MYPKAFADTRGERCSIKLSLIPIYFIVKMTVPTQKDPEVFEIDNNQAKLCVKGQTTNFFSENHEHVQMLIVNYSLVLVRTASIKVLTSIHTPCVEQKKDQYLCKTQFGCVNVGSEEVQITWASLDVVK